MSSASVWSKKGFNDPDKQYGVVTRIEPDILMCGPYKALLQTNLLEVFGFLVNY